MVDGECTPDFNCCHWQHKDVTSLLEVRNVSGDLGKKTSSRIMDNMFVITGADRTDKTSSLVKELLDPSVISSNPAPTDVIILTRSATDEMRLREEIIRLGSDNISNGLRADKIKEFSHRAIAKFFNVPLEFIINRDSEDVCKFINKLRNLKEDSLLHIYIDGCSEELRSALKVYAESPNICIHITTDISQELQIEPSFSFKAGC